MCTRDLRVASTQPKVNQHLYHVRTSMLSEYIEGLSNVDGTFSFH